MQNKGDYYIKRYRTYTGMHSLGRTWDRTRDLGDCTVFIMHCLRERPKAEKGRNQAGIMGGTNTGKWRGGGE